MQKISKIQMDTLISKGILKLSKQGNFGDQLVVVNKQGSGKEKTRFINDNIYNQLLRMESQSKVNPETVKHNQTYLLSAL